VGASRGGSKIDPQLFKRIRESGDAAVETARKLPAILANPHLSVDELRSLDLAVQQCRASSAGLTSEARSAKNKRLLHTAEKVESLWIQLMASLAARSRKFDKAA
jgi:hypothetical protein